MVASSLRLRFPLQYFVCISFVLILLGSCVHGVTVSLQNPRLELQITGSQIAVIPKDTNGFQDPNQPFVLKMPFYLLETNTSDASDFVDYNEFIPLLTVPYPFLPTATAFITSEETTLADGTVRTRIFSTINNPSPQSNPLISNDYFVEVMDIFSQSTVTTMYGSNIPVSVSDDSVYYTQFIDMSRWSLSPGSTYMKIITQYGASGIPISSPFRSVNFTTFYVNYVSTPNLQFFLYEPADAMVDGVSVPMSRYPSYSTPSYPAYISTLSFPAPAYNASITYTLSVFRPSLASNDRPPVRPSPGYVEYQKSTLGVGIFFGLAGLFTVIAFATYFFCLGPWLFIWGYISWPARKVYWTVDSWRNPPAPLFTISITVDDDDEEYDGQDGEDEDDDYNNLDDSLAGERVDPAELLRSGIMGGLTGGHPGAMKKLRSAMGRRLSNFIGWDGPTHDSDAGSSKQATKKKKKKKKSKEGDDVEVDQEVRFSRGIDESDYGDQQSLLNAISVAPGTTNVTGHAITDSIDENGNPPPRYSSPPKSRDNFSGSREELPPFNPEGSSGEGTPPGSAKSTGSDSPPSSGNTKGKGKKAAGLRGFKITTHSSKNSDTQPVVFTSHIAMPSSSRSHGHAKSQSNTDSPLAGSASATPSNSGTQTPTNPASPTSHPSEHSN